MLHPNPKGPAIRAVMLASYCLLVCLGAPTARAQDHEHAQGPPKNVPGSSMPFVKLDDAGRLHMVFVEDTGENKLVRYRRMFGVEHIESVISSPGDRLSHFPDSPPVVEVTSDGAVHALYTVRVPGPPNVWPVELRYVTSRDEGRTWSPYKALGDPGAAVFRGCAAMLEDARGRLVMSWLEGHPGQGEIGVNTAVVKNDTFTYAFIDDMACECCATELLRASDGAIWLAYRNKDAFNVRDMYAARMARGDDRFGPPNRISRDGWVVNGCPENGPRLARGGAHTVWAAWFTGGEPRGIYAGRASSATPLFETRELVQGRDEHVSAIGHVAISALPDGRVLIAYNCQRDGQGRIEGRFRQENGWGDPIQLGGNGIFPRIATNGHAAYLVYTAIDGEQKSIVVEKLDSELPRS